jgi:AcrR family transcriptional regulator
MQKYLKPGKSVAAKVRARGRPRTFDRGAALAEATRLFWEKGYEATSISDLTEALGIGAPSLYAAFGSKDALYIEALRHYQESNAALVWGRFAAARTAREAVQAFLEDSAAVLTGAVVDIPRGCMVTLSSPDSAGNEMLNRLLKEARALTFDRLLTRFGQAKEAGEIPASADLRSLARFVQTVQGGMSILARDGVSTAEVTEVARLAMLGWDARVG